MDKDEYIKLREKAWNEFYQDVIEGESKDFVDYINKESESLKEAFTAGYEKSAMNQVGSLLSLIGISLHGLKVNKENEIKSLDNHK